MRSEQSAAQRGSQRWLQIAVNRCPEIINSAIVNELGLCSSEKIEWLSPLGSDGFAEYRDEEFIEHLNVSLNNRSLKDFWPRKGPQWDGLARTSSGRRLLLEAKANIPEFDTNPTGATGTSLKKIKTALTETKEFLGVTSETDWFQCFYQYTNRLAHLYLLRERNNTQCLLGIRLLRKRPGRSVTEIPFRGKRWEDRNRACHQASRHTSLPVGLLRT